jgi:hypothetical protein
LSRPLGAYPLQKAQGSLERAETVLRWNLASFIERIFAGVAEQVHFNAKCKVQIEK